MLGEAAAYKCLTQQWGGWDHPMGLSGPLGSLVLSFPTWALSRLMSLFVTKSCVSILKQPQENWKFYNSCSNAERLSNIGLSSVFNDVWKKRCCVFLIRIYTFCVQLHDCLKQTADLLSEAASCFCSEVELCLQWKEETGSAWTISSWSQNIRFQDYAVPHWWKAF